MSKRRRDPPPSIPISRTEGGQEFRGSYTVQDGLVDVRLHAVGGGSKATQVGGSSPATVAGWLFHELISEFQAKAKP